MKGFAGSLVFALILFCLPAEAQQDADQTEAVNPPTKGTIQDVHLDRHAWIKTNTCNPTHVDFRGRIKTDGPTFVTYRWVRSDGTFTDGTLNFTKADARPVGTDWAQKSTYSGWIMLVVLTPKHVETPKAYFQVHCGTGG